MVKIYTLCLTIIACYLQIIASEDYDVLILGAGFAGLGAALEFHEKNQTNFLVLEAKDYIGGRAKSGVINGSTVELGAGWLHSTADDHSLYQLAKKYNMSLLADDTDISDNVVRNGEDGSQYLKNDIKSVKDGLIENMDTMDELVEKRMEAGRGEPDLATGMRWAGWRVKNKLDQVIEYYMFDYENGIEPNAISGTAYSFTGYGEGTDYIVADQRGYTYPVKEEIKPIQDKIILNSPVTKIKKLSNNKFEVTIKNGSVFTSKHVLVTFSSGVVISGNVEFEPELPEWKTEVLSFAPMSHYCRIYAQFENKFWDNAMYILIGTKHRGQYFHWQNYDVDSLLQGKNIFLATLTGQVCYESQLKSDEEIKKEIFDVLKKVYPNATAPIDLLRNNWSQDPYFLGAYSYLTTGITEDDFIAIAHPVDQSLWFAGEYANGYDYGYTHGAYDSGRSTASKMIDCINGNCPSVLPERTPKCPPQPTNAGLNLTSNIFYILIITVISILCR